MEVKGFKELRNLIVFTGWTQNPNNPEDLHQYFYALIDLDTNKMYVYPRFYKKYPKKKVTLNSFGPNYKTMRGLGFLGYYKEGEDMFKTICERAEDIWGICMSNTTILTQYTLP